MGGWGAMPAKTNEELLAMAQSPKPQKCEGSFPNGEILSPRPSGQKPARSEGTFGIGPLTAGLVAHFRKRRFGKLALNRFMMCNT